MQSEIEQTKRLTVRAACRGGGMPSEMELLFQIRGLKLHMQTCKNNQLSLDHLLFLKS